MIGEQNYTLGFGGAELMISQANDYISDDEDYTVVLETLKERLRNDLSSCDTLLQHNATVFYELDDTLSKHDRALVVIGTGLGKTTTALAYIRKYGMRGLVLGPNRIITDAWEKNEDVDTYTYQWFMNNYKTIDYSKYGVMICDEAHHCAAPKWGEGIRYVLDNGLIKVMGLTATPKENKDKKNLETSRQFFQNHVCQGFTVLDGIEREIIHDFSYIGAIYDTTGIKEMCSKCSDTALLGELDLALNNTPTVKEILTRHMPNNKRKGIIFVSNIGAIGEAISIMKDIYPNAEYRAMHSLMPTNEIDESRDWFQNTDEGYLLAVNMISEGAHYRGVNTIIMFRRTQSSLVFHQQLGRIITLARDEDPHAIVFDLVNNATNLDAEKSFSGSLREAYRQRKERGGKQKSEQIIVEDYAEKISEILRQIQHPGTTKKRTIVCLNDMVKFDSISDCARIRNLDTGSLTNCCEGKLYRVGGNVYRYYEDVKNLTEKEIKAIIEGLPVYTKSVLCLNNNTLYESGRAAEIELNLPKDKPGACCRGERTSTKGYYFIFSNTILTEEECKRLIAEKSNGKWNDRKKKVRNKTTGEIFDSIAAANRAYHTSKVGDCCRGSRSTAGECEWEFV